MEAGVDVAVVGGGPTGLMLACELALAGVRAVVLERRSERVAQARALSMQPRSVEILALRGLAERFLARGVPVPSGHYGALDVRLDFSVLDTSFPASLLVPQTVTEELLEDRALELGVDVRRGWRVESILEAEDGVRVSGVNAHGAFEVEACYLVGADGARSVVRGESAIDFPGNDNEHTCYFGDVFITGAPQPGRFALRNEAGIVEAFPMVDGRRRLVLVDPQRVSVPISTPVTLEEMQDGVRRIIGPDVILSDPAWMSRFGDETRLADCYRQGRVFLAGDAAHIHLPTGGQGMNTGLQDAMNLGWKLAGVLQGLAPATLLDSYEAERRPVGQRLINNTLAQSAVVFAFGRQGMALRSAMNQLLGIPVVNRQVSEMITALDTTYPNPMLAGHDVGAERWAGRRLPDGKLRLANGDTTTLYALMERGEWLDLLIDTDAASPLPPGVAPGWVRTETGAFVDEASSLQELSSVLVRPDGHVAFSEVRRSIDTGPASGK